MNVAEMSLGYHGGILRQIYFIIINLLSSNSWHQSTAVILELKQWGEEVVKSPPNKYLY